MNKPFTVELVVLLGTMPNQYSGNEERAFCILPRYPDSIVTEAGTRIMPNFVIMTVAHGSIKAAVEQALSHGLVAGCDPESEEFKILLNHVRVKILMPYLKSSFVNVVRKKLPHSGPFVESFHFAKYDLDETWILYLTCDRNENIHEGMKVRKHRFVKAEINS